MTGYNAPKCILTRKAVDDFVDWVKNLGDLKMKREFYPHVDKSNLFRDGYIAGKWGQCSRKIACV